MRTAITSTAAPNEHESVCGRHDIDQEALAERCSGERAATEHVLVVGAVEPSVSLLDGDANAGGVFAIETKTWPGLIFPTNDRELWTQKVGRAINMHSSPVRQNERQVRALARHLDLRPNLIYGLVCFNGPNTRFADAIPPNVVLAERLTPSILRRQKVVLNDHGVAQAADSITALK